MTDRYNMLYVTLEQDMRYDDAKATIDAILQIKGVITVDARIVDAADHVARSRIRVEFWEKIRKFIWET